MPPFSKPGLFRELDKRFPGSKFILTVRDSPEQWFDSMLNFHAKKAGVTPPTEETLSEVKNIYKGWLLDYIRITWNYPEIELYDEVYYKRVYSDHINDVKEYFSTRPKDLLVVNVANPYDFPRLVSFLNVKTKMNSFPWVKKTIK